MNPRYVYHPTSWPRGLILERAEDGSYRAWCEIQQSGRGLPIVHALNAHEIELARRRRKAAKS